MTNYPALRTIIQQSLAKAFLLSGRDGAKTTDRIWIEDRINRLVIKGIEDTLVLGRWERS